MCQEKKEKIINSIGAGINSGFLLCKMCWLLSHLQRRPYNEKQSAVQVNCSGGGFFLVCKDLGRMVDNLFPSCAFFSFFFLKCRIGHAH